MTEPYYRDEQVTLYHGDCLQVMRSLPDESVDIVVTSPPYNMGLVPGGNGRGMYRPGANNKGGRFREGYGQHADAMDQAEYDAWQREALAEMWRIARLAVFYNHRPRVEHGRLRDPLGNDFGIPLRQRIIWNRGTGIDVNLRAFCTRGEYVYFFAKPEMRLVSHAVSGMGDVWDLGIEYAVKDHPAPFPVSLPTRCITATGATSVLDPFCGSGSTLRAAKDLGAVGVGVELEERYCEVIAKRLSQGVLDFGEASA
ncbi:site-specific DNA-methyltransferase [Epidermidibacterium keratini]|uniref:Methyltransferase n=1 Tax=Epidermidibacterium keratini TaxID=1891644 RepID=A0A7L4YK46_9ACTN|nr:site-specific DNA-methyltransferase [Epidermidibacterium keratini]QHB99461.1 site-specific DNA-methyltransferase [Epidermidibacterium keratini]